MGIVKSAKGWWNSGWLHVVGSFVGLIVSLNSIYTYLMMHVLGRHKAIPEAILVFMVPNVEQSSRVDNFWRQRNVRWTMNLSEACEFDFDFENIFGWPTTSGRVEYCQYAHYLLLHLPIRFIRQSVCVDRSHQRVCVYFNTINFWYIWLIIQNLDKPQFFHTVELPEDPVSTARLLDCLFCVFVSAWNFRDHWTLRPLDSNFLSTPRNALSDLLSRGWNLSARTVKWWTEVICCT